MFLGLLGGDLPCALWVQKPLGPSEHHSIKGGYRLSPGNQVCPAPDGRAVGRARVGRVRLGEREGEGQKRADTCRGCLPG